MTYISRAIARQGGPLDSAPGACDGNEKGSLSRAESDGDPGSVLSRLLMQERTSAGHARIPWSAVAPPAEGHSSERSLGHWRSIAVAGIALASIALGLWIRTLDPARSSQASPRALEPIAAVAPAIMAAEPKPSPTPIVVRVKIDTLKPLPRRAEHVQAKKPSAPLEPSFAESRGAAIEARKTRQDAFHLEGIFWSASAPAAVINGEIVEVGDRIGAARVKKIERHRAVLEAGGEEFKLDI